MGLNYELIYKVRHAGVDTSEPRNLEIRYANKAREEAKIVHKKYTDLLKQILGHERFEVTNVACNADAIAGHVYTWDGPNTPQRGVGKKHCVFCGCDDGDD